MQRTTKQTYYIKTLGCQANIADSQKIAGVLEALGFEQTVEISGRNEDETLLQTLPNTDLFIVNTCSVRQKSEDKVYGLGRIIKKIKKKPFIVMAGGMVGSVTGERLRYEFKTLENKTPWVNAYINPSQIMEIPRILIAEGLLNEWAIQKFNSQQVESLQDQKKHAFVNISYGCDNFCTYCVVPYSRGKEISRSKEEIISEVSNLVKRGFTEVTLCGQNVNSWGLGTKEKFEIRAGSDQKLPFAELLRETHTIEGIEKIDFMSSNPFDFTQDLIEAIKLPRISNYFHIAVQSGNNEVLKKMNRRHTIEEFLDLMKRIKEARPNAEIGTDIIVGFPGETREQFMDTVSLFEKVKFNVAFISIYSPRIGTPAEKFMNDDVPAKEKKWRHSYLMKTWRSNKGEKSE